MYYKLPHHHHIDDIHYHVDIHDHYPTPHHHEYHPSDLFITVDEPTHLFDTTHDDAMHGPRGVPYFDRPVDFDTTSVEPTRHLRFADHNGRTDAADLIGESGYDITHRTH